LYLDITTKPQAIYLGVVINVAYHDAEFVQFVNKFLDGPISLVAVLEVLSLGGQGS